MPARHNNAPYSASDALPDSTIDIPDSDPRLDSGKCPICLELMMAPSKAPMIIFPCGHSACDSCLKMALEAKPCCPMCRADVVSTAPNIPLRNMLEELGATPADVPAIPTHSQYADKLVLLDKRIALMKTQLCETAPSHEEMECSRAADRWAGEKARIANEIADLEARQREVDQKLAAARGRQSELRAAREGIQGQQDGVRALVQQLEKERVKVAFLVRGTRPG